MSAPSSTIALRIDGQDISVHLRPSARAKRTRIVVTADKVEVVAPVPMDCQVIERFLRENRLWIAKKRHDIKQRCSDPGIYHPYKGAAGSTIPLFGQATTVQIKRMRIDQPTVTFGKALTVTLPEDVLERHQSSLVRDTLKHWLFRYLGDEAGLFVRQHQPRCGLQPNSIRIKEQKTRWGSCGIRNDVHINWRLVFAPKSVTEYVVVHELCHIQHRNHSSRFWALVGQHLPDFQNNRAWLREHGAKLMRVL